MPNTLFIRPLQIQPTPPGAERLFEWALFDIAGSLLKYNSKTSLDIIDQTLMQNGLEQVDLVGLLPSYAALRTEVTVPGNQSRYIQQALPFAVEDQIAQDIDQMHLVLGEKDKNGLFSVVAVDHSLFEPFFNELNREDLVGVLKSIYLDTDLLHLEHSFLKILLTQNEAYVLDSRHKSIRLRISNLIPYLDSIFLAPESKEDSEDTRQIDVIIDKTAKESSKLLLAEIQQYPRVSISISEEEITGFEYLCSEYFQHKKPVLNLCQGNYQVSSRSQGAWSRWKSVALIAGIGFLLQLGIFIGEGVYLNKQAEKISEQALFEYKKVQPNAANITAAKLPRIIKGQLNQLSAGGVSKLDFLELLGEAGNQFNSSPHKSTLVFNSINYSEQRGELMLEMHAKSFDQLEALKKAIVDAGLAAKISSAVQEKDYFKGRISISGV